MFSKNIGETSSESLCTETFVDRDMLQSNRTHKQNTTLRAFGTTVLGGIRNTLRPAFF